MTRFRLCLLTPLLAGLASLLLASVFLAACDNFERNAYRTLKLTKVEYELLQEEAARAYLDARLTQEQWDRFAVAGNRFIAAHTLAADLMKAYQQARSSRGAPQASGPAAQQQSENIQRQVTAVLANLPTLLADLRALLASFDAPPAPEAKP